MIDVSQPNSEFLLCTIGNERVWVECWFQDGTIWLSQKLMAELFGVKVSTINEHLRTLCETGEIEPDRVVRNFRIVRRKGGRQSARNLEHYKLEAILTLGFRV